MTALSASSPTFNPSLTPAVSPSRFLPSLLSLHDYHHLCGPSHYHTSPAPDNSLQTSVLISISSISLNPLHLIKQGSDLTKIQIRPATLPPKVLQRFPIPFRINSYPLKGSMMPGMRLSLISHTLSLTLQRALQSEAFCTLCRLCLKASLAPCHALSLAVASSARPLWAATLSILSVVSPNFRFFPPYNLCCLSTHFCYTYFYYLLPTSCP